MSSIFGNYVLVETVASANQGRTLYFKQMTAIGPMTTADLGSAQRFATEQDARMHPAMFHMLTVFEPREVRSEAKA
jgi:hypothetical protein